MDWPEQDPGDQDAGGWQNNPDPFDGYPTVPTDVFGPSMAVAKSIAAAPEAWRGTLASVGGGPEESWGGSPLDPGELDPLGKAYGSDWAPEGYGVGERTEQRPPDWPGLDLPPLPFSGPAPFYQPNKPVLPDDETRRKFEQGQPFDAEDFARYAVRATQQQYSTLPTSAEAMGAGHVGATEGEMAGAFANPHAPGEGLADLPSLYPKRAAAAEVVGDGGLVDHLGRPLSSRPETPPEPSGIEPQPAAPEAPTDEVSGAVRDRLGALPPHAGEAVDELTKAGLKPEDVTGAPLPPGPDGVHAFFDRLATPEGKPSPDVVDGLEQRNLTGSDLAQAVRDEPDPDKAWDLLAGAPRETLARSNPVRARITTPPPTEPPTLNPQSLPPAVREHIVPATNWLQNLGRWANDVRYGSMLSSPQSWPRLLVDNTLEVPAALLTNFGGAVAKRDLASFSPQAAAALEGVKDWLPTFLETVRSGVQPSDAERMGYVSQQVPYRFSAPVVGGVMNAVGNASRLPVRVHMGLSEATHQLVRGIAVAEGAAEQATKEGLRPGTTEWASRVDWLRMVADDLAQGERDAALGRETRALGLEDDAAERINRAANLDADVATFRNQPPRGTLSAGGVLKRIQDLPVVGRVLAPFSTIPYNVAAREVDRTPVGLLGTAIDALRGSYRDPERLPQGTIPLDTRLRNNVIGSGLTALGALMASQGVMTGHGPPDGPPRRAWLAAGGRPDSIEVGGHWVPAWALGAWGLPLRLGAHAHDAYAYGTPFPAAAADFAKDWVAESPFGQVVGLRDLLDPYARPRFVARLLDTFVPLGGALRVAAEAPDPSMRQASSVGDNLANSIPFLRNTLPERFDARGDAVPNPHAGVNALNPFAQTQPTDDATLRLLVDHGVPFPSPRRYRGSALTDDQRRLFARTVAPLADERVRDVAGSPAFAQARPEERSRALADAVDQATRDAFRRLDTALLPPVRPEVLTQWAQAYDRANGAQRERVYADEGHAGWLPAYLRWRRENGLPTRGTADGPTVERFLAEKGRVGR